MATRIVTSNKNDIVTGFDITADFDFYEIITGVLSGRVSLPDEVFHELAAQMEQQAEPQVKNLIDQAEEIFIEEASLSIWSGNMIDNSVCGISGSIDYQREAIYVDVRIGVNHKQIMNKANWDSHKNRFYGKHPRFVNPIVYTYNGYRMHQPFVDYSVFLEEGTARIPNAAAWAGFVERAEERFDAL